MKQHERDIISYRPDIDYETRIRNLVETKIRPIDSVVTQDDEIVSYQTDIVTEFLGHNLITVIDGYKEMQETKKKMQDIIERGIEYEKQTGQEIGSDDYVRDINDEPIGDAIRAAEEILKEIDNLEELIENIYDIDLDTADLDELVEIEQARIDDIKQKEKEDISYYKSYKFSETEREYIDRLIHERSTGVDSLNTYIEQLIQEQREAGSHRVDYPSIRDDVKRAFALESLISTVNVSGLRLSEASRITMNDVMGRDTQGGLLYLVDTANRSDVKSMSELNFRRVNRDADVIHGNMSRHNDADFRSYLYEHFVEVDKMKRRYAYNTRINAVTGQIATAPFAALNNSTKSMVDTTYDNVIVDLLASSYTLSHQLKALTETIEQQKEYSLMYRFADIIDREFDFEHKEREFNVFLSRHQIESMQ